MSHSLQAGFHIGSGQKDLSQMLDNHGKKPDNSAVYENATQLLPSLSIYNFRYHSWINSLFENILHELDEKFEVAEEDRDKTNFWLTVMASFGLLSIVCGVIGFVIMYIKCKKRPSRDWTEMDEFNRELPPNRRSSRVEDMNITVKREHN